MHVDLRFEPPAAGRTQRLELAGVQWLVERARGGVRVVALDGEPLWKAILGLPAAGRLSVFARFPAAPLEWEPSHPLLLAPGGALRGWLVVPLVCGLAWIGADGTERELALLPDPELKQGWREEDGYFHPWRSGLGDGPRGRRALPARRAFCRLAVLNGGREVERIARLRLPLAGAEPARSRAGLVGPCVRVGLGPRGGTRLRPLPGTGGRGPAAARHAAPETRAAEVFP